MLKKMENVSEKVGKWLFEHTYTSITIEAVLGLVIAGVKIACDIRKFRLMGKNLK